MVGLAGAFAAAMDRLGPFEPAAALAAAVSGGADSLALALLARDWAGTRGGNLLALVVDHNLRPESAAEAHTTIARLQGQGIDARLLTLGGLMRGPGLAARARIARHAALEAECVARGIVHLLFGHHAGDQAETLRMREAAGSGPRGMAGMAALVESALVRRLRPLLAVPPGRLRALLRAASLDWIEDPSNRDPATLRARLRVALDDPAGEGAEVAALVAVATRFGHARAADDVAIATELAARVRLYPGGWAVLSGGAISPAALSALLCTIAGRHYPAPSVAVAALAARPRAATLAGARLLPAGRFGGGGDWLVVREAAAMQPAVPATPGAIWDKRFQLAGTPARPGFLGPLGAASAGLRNLKLRLPSAVLHTLPALWCGGALAAVPALDWPDGATAAGIALHWRPVLALAAAPFRTI